jgi:hypothetical protein
MGLGREAREVLGRSGLVSSELVNQVLGGG